MSAQSELQQKLGDRYTVQRELRGGGMALVFLAEDTRLHRRVVIKVLAPELASSVTAERFAREILLVATLQQANLVPLLDAGEIDGVPWFSMPYVEGESLGARLEAAGSLPVAQVVGILRDVARALAYAHAQGVVHRDIKPDNILLSGDTAVVTDFGIAKAIVMAQREQRDAAGDSTFTGLGISLGTPAYMSPEQAAADPHVDQRADVYALGCTAYEMLAGTPPFVTSSISQTLAAHVDLEPRNVRQLRPKMPATLAELVMQCLEKNPADRPTARDVLQRLESIPTATVSSASTSTAGPGMRRPLLWYAAAFVLVIAAAWLAVSLTGLPDWVFAGAVIVMALGAPMVLLTAFTSSRHLSWKRVTIGGAIALSCFVAIVAGYMILRSLGIGPGGSLLAAGRVAAKQSVLVADFRSLVPDSTLGGVLAEAIRADLRQSKVVKVVSDAQVASALGRMQRPSSSHVDYALARDIARREGIPAIIDGEIRALGAGYLVSIRLTQTDSATTLAEFQESADTPARLIPTLGSLTKKLRARIGESLKDVRESLPLDRVTTASLPALEKYTEAERAFNRQDFERFSRDMEDAIALDSGFAMAYRRLATELVNRGGQMRRTELLMKKAVEHGARLPPAERYLAIGSYWTLPAHVDADRALDAFQRVIELDSTNAAAMNNIGLLYERQRDVTHAEEWYQRAKRANPDLATLYLNLTFTRYAVGGLPALRAHLAEMKQRFPERPMTRSLAALALRAEGMPDSTAALDMARYDPHARGGPSEPAAFMVATIRLTEGRLAEATDWYGKWNQIRNNRGVRATDVDVALGRAWIVGWLLDDRTGAARIADSLVSSDSYRALDVEDKRYDWFATVYGMAGRPDRARAVIAEAERVDGWSPAGPSLSGDDDRQMARHTALGWIALGENHPDAAVAEFRKADVGACLTCAPPLIALALDRANRPDSAIVAYERFLNIRELSRESDSYYLALAYKRLGELYERKGDKRRAIEYYTKFVDLWKRADPPLQPVVRDVRGRLVQLSRLDR